jgi:acetyl-CoA carboxylase carboxyl transferase subunit beta
MIFHRDLEANLRVCPHCGHHMRIGVLRRLELLFDGGTYERADLPPVPLDPLRFRDRKKYVDRLKDAQAKTTEQDAIVVASGTIGGLKVTIAAFNFDFMGGSMGVAVGEGLVKAAEIAVADKATLIAIPASGGARMQEGILSLMQMPRSVIAVDRVKEAGLPFIVLLTDPTTGGVSASFAMLGDIHISEPGAQIGFAGARVIEETIREKLPEGFQRAEYLLDHGIVDLVIARKDLSAELAKIIGLLTKQVPGPVSVPAPVPPTALVTTANSAGVA